MKRTILHVLACAWLILTTPAVLAAYSWDVRPGPNGTLRVTTANGDYIVDIHGDSGWVGTEQEYQARHVAAVLNREGFREMKINGQDANTHRMVSSSLPRVSVGSTNLADIDTVILFGIGPDKKLHRPPKPADSEYVGINWVQSDNAETQAKIIDLENRKTYSPTICRNIPEAHMRACDFIVPRESLPHRAALLFATPKGQPGLVPLASLAQEYGKILLEKYKVTMRSRFALDEDDAAALKSLHELDNSIAATLPPLQPGEKEIGGISGCKVLAQELTQAQYDAIVIGETIDKVECRLGEHAQAIAHTASTPEEHARAMQAMKSGNMADRDNTNHRTQLLTLDYIWKMKAGGYALITNDATNSATVLGKRIQMQRPTFAEW